MKKCVVALGATMVLVAVGCVITTRHTIDAHIVVDIRHIQQQADDVLDFIEGKSETLPGLEGPAQDDTSWTDRVLDALTPIRVAYAEELKAASPLIGQIAKKLKERHPAIQKLKADELLGEDNRGYVALRNDEKFTDPKKKNAAQKLVAAENADRKALYKDIARLNKDKKVTLSTVERVYAQKRLERAKPGDLFQLPRKGEEFDKFKASALGKKLGEACQPGAWVKIK